MIFYLFRTHLLVVEESNCRQIRHPLSIPLWDSNSKFPSSNFANVIISSDFPWKYSIWYVQHFRPHSHCFWILLWRVRQRTKEALIKNDIVRRYDIAFFLYINKIPFLMLWNSNKDTSKTFCAWWLMFNAFVPTCAVTFCTTHGHHKTREYDI